MLLRVCAIFVLCAASAGADCPQLNTTYSWHEHGGFCFLPWYLPVGGHQQLNSCEDRHPGSRPVSVHSADVSEFLRSDLLNFIVPTAWIGLTRSDEDGGSWVWMDGSDVNVTYWAFGQPRPEDSCAVVNYLHVLGRWISMPCNETLPYICQIDAM